MSEIARYFEEMRVRLGVVDESKKEIDRLVAPDFNLYTILWTDEVRLSNMIASLLKPNGSHGQGTKFLDAFLETIETVSQSTPIASKIRQIRQVWTGSTNIKVEIEQSTSMIEASQRRMDILVSDGKFGLMIENKPWASDQKNQMKDYGTEMSRRFEGRHAMIYLSGDGTPPGSDSITEESRADLEYRGELLTISYNPHLIDWLKRCLDLSEADRVRWIIKDFIKFIEVTFRVSTSDKSEEQ